MNDRLASFDEKITDQSSEIHAGTTQLLDFQYKDGRLHSADTTVPALEDRQAYLWQSAPSAESFEYLSQQIITYIGNKRTFLGEIGSAVNQVKQRLGKQQLRIFDAFSGSGIVSRFFKAHASLLISNDIEDYTKVISNCYLSNKSTVDMKELSDIIDDHNMRVETVNYPRGFIEELYAPQNESAITNQDRVFYTRNNAKRLDNYRRMLDEDVPDRLREFVLAPLICKASVHSNTAGVFKGFYKNRNTGIGQFGGTGSDALERIKATIQLELPILSEFECDYQVLQEDTNRVAQRLHDLDLVYIDPPYNQHPYGSNYFMLNLLVNYERPDRISRVSGIPTDWRRSGYNVKTGAAYLLRQLLDTLDTRFILVSFNDEGFIRPDEMRMMLARIGKVDEMEKPYNVFRGSRNFRNRSIHVTERLFLVERR